MANGYVCAQCGWQESVHINGGVGLDEEGRKELFVPKEGCPVSHMDCEGYTPSQEERDAEGMDEEDGQHEGCH